MNFLHVKIFTDNLDAESMTEGIGITPVFVYRAGSAEGKKDAWMYTEETDDDMMNAKIASLVNRLYENRDFFVKLKREDPSAELYFVTAYYANGYQGIVSFEDDTVAKLAEMGFKLTVDIMSP